MADADPGSMIQPRTDYVVDPGVDQPALPEGALAVVGESTT